MISDDAQDFDPEAEQEQVIDVMAELIEDQYADNLPTGAVVLAVVENQQGAIGQPDVGIDVMAVAVDPDEQEMEEKGNIDLHIALRL